MASLPLERSPDAELVDPLRAGKLAGAGLDVFGAVRRQPRPIPLGPPARQPVRARAGLLTGGGGAPRVSDALPTVHPLEAETAAPSDAGPACGDDGDLTPTLDDLEIEVTLTLWHQATPDAATALLGEHGEGHRRSADSPGSRHELQIKAVRGLVAVLTPPPLSLLQLRLCFRSNPDAHQIARSRRSISSAEIPSPRAACSIPRSIDASSSARSSAVISSHSATAISTSVPSGKSMGSSTMIRPRSMRPRRMATRRSIPRITRPRSLRRPTGRSCGGPWDRCGGAPVCRNRVPRPR